ncbi:Calx-beta domain-containing protein [Vibrio rotiferianus]|uniref:Calx-beta domain-containing protein n=3 Tax=Vibrio rotiferianus TaxID=190895 RepID=UPI000C5AC0EA|nr:Calx-beta domain-containing protein [Vibrio rotiferianus]PIB17276.1 calcium-binding outer membrane-like protein [Vibrio rotiferianus CAIM 577 = LMG 21460]
MGQIDLRTLLGTTVVIGLDGNIKQLENGESPLSGELVIQELSQPNDVTIQRVGRDGTTQDITSDVQQVFEAIAQGLDPAELGEEFNPAAGEGLGSSPQVTGAIDRTGAESLAATLFETNASGFGVLSNTQILSLLELFQSFQSGELLTLPVIQDISSPTINEGENVVFDITLDQPGSQDTELTLILNDGTAFDGQDFDSLLVEISLPDGTVVNPQLGPQGELIVTLPSGESGLQLTIPTIEDDITEGDESFTLSGTTTAQQTPVQGTAIIVDNDDMPTVTDVALVGETVPEGQPAEFKVTLSNASSSDQTYTIGLVNGTAGDDDYDTNVSNIVFSDGVTYDANTGQITVPAGVTMFTATVDTTQDTIDEPDETFDLQVGGVTGTATIIDDDGVPTITDVALVGETVPEGQAAEFKVTLSNASSSDQTYMIGLLNGTAGDDDYDTNVSNIVFSDGVTYDANTGQITVPAGITMFTATVDTTQDTIDEPDETFDLQVGGVTGTATIIDDDGVPTITDVALVGDTVPEGQPAEFKVTLSNASSSDQTYAIGLFNGTAGDNDYDTNVSNIVFSDGVTYDANTGQITVPAGVTMFTAIVDTTQDTIDEPDETFDLQVGGVTGTATIQDDDDTLVPPPVVTEVGIDLDTGDTRVPEGDDAVFTVKLSNTSATSTAFDIGLLNGTATIDDYDEALDNLTFNNGVTYDPVNQQIIVPAGIDEFTVAVSTEPDSIDEPDETFFLNVGGVAGIATIVDDDEPPVPPPVVIEVGIDLATGDTRVPEGDDAVFTVKLSNTSATSTAFDIGLLNGTATIDDYDEVLDNLTFNNGVTYDPVNQQIIVPAGVDEFTVAVSTEPDSIDEPDETFFLNVGGVAGTATIVDDDEPPVPPPVVIEVGIDLATGDTRVPEGDDAVFTVKLSNTSATSTAFDIGLLNGTATIDDYDEALDNLTFNNGVTYDPVNQQIIVPAGVDEFTVTVGTVPDTIDEPDETFFLNVGGVQGTATIVDDDLPNTPPTVRDFGILLDIEDGIFPVQDVDFDSVTGAGLQRVEDLEDDAVTANDGDIEIEIIELPSFGELFFVDENNREVIIDQDFINDSSSKLYEDTEVKYRLTEDFFDEQSFDSQDLLDEFDKDFLADSVDVNGLSFYGGTIDSNGDFVNNAQIKVDFAAQQVGLVVVSPGETGQGDEISTSEFIAIDLDDGLEAKEARLNLASLNDRFNSGAAWINVYFYMDGVLAETQVIQTDDIVFTGNQQGFATVAISSGSFDEIRLFPETDSASDKASFTLVGTQITSFNNVNDSFDYQAVDSGGLTSTDTATVDIEFSNVSVDAVEASAVQVASMQANNIVQGTDQDDTLVGTDGNDILIGGLGDDLLTGGGGNDVFKWTEMDDATDTVTDFGDGDSLDFVDLFDGVTEYDLSILLDDLSSGDYAGQVDDVSVSVTESGINSTLTINKDGQQLEVNFDGASAADIANSLISNLEQLRE